MSSPRGRGRLRKASTLLGAVHYLVGLFAEAGDISFSVVVRVSYDGLALTGSSLVAGPIGW